MTFHTVDGGPVGVSDLTVGDRIAPALVARAPDGIGESQMHGPDGTGAHLAQATITRTGDAIQTAMLVDGHSGRIAIAERHTATAAWTADEAAWTVHDLGDRITATDTDVVHKGDRVWGDPDTAAERWANGVIGPLARGGVMYHDLVAMESVKVARLEDEYDGAKVRATVALEDDDD